MSATLTTEQVEEILAGCEAVTPGPWFDENPGDEAAKGGGVDASFPTALSDSEVRIWINACNHEPARQALRQLLAYRVRGVSSALTSPASGERDAVIEVTDAMVEDGAVAIDALWSEGQDRGPAFAETEREYQAHCRSTARAALVAALRMEGK